MGEERVERKKVRGITGLGLIILVFMTIFGMTMVSMLTGAMQAGSPTSIFMEMERLKPELEDACLRKPSEVKNLTVIDEETGETVQVSSSNLEFINAPPFPIQINCMTCDELTERAGWRFALSSAMIAGEILSLKGGGDVDDISDNVDECADGMTRVLKESGEEYSDEAAEAYAKGVKEAKRAGAKSSDEFAEAGAKRVLDAGLGSADDVAKLHGAFYSSVDDFYKGAVEITQEGMEESLESAVRNYNDEVASTYDDMIGTVDDEIADINKQMDEVADEFYDGTRPYASVEADPEYKQLKASKESLEGSKDDIVKAADDLSVAADDVSRMSDEAWEIVNGQGWWSRVTNTLKPAPRCAAGGFMRAWRGGVAGTGFGTARSLKRNGVCAAAYAATAAPAHFVLNNYTIVNYRYAKQNVDGYVRMLNATRDHYLILVNVTNSSYASLPISLDVALLVNHKHPEYDFFKSRNESLSASFITRKSDQIDNILYDLFENELNDPAFAEFYFGPESETRPSNKIWTSHVMGPVNDYNEVQVKLRPNIINSLTADTRILIERNAESYPEIYPDIQDQFDLLYNKYSFNYIELKDFTLFLKLLTGQENDWDQLGIPEPLTDSPLLIELREKEIQSGRTTTTLKQVENIIDYLEDVQKLIDDIRQEQIDLLKLQDKAWNKLKAGCKSDPIEIGNFEIVKSTCASITNCNWDYALDYAHFEGKELTVGDCVQLAAVVNEPSVSDPLTGDQIWRAMPAFKIDAEKAALISGMLNKALRIGYQKAQQRIWGGVGFGGIGRMANAWTDVTSYCEGSSQKKMVCCVEKTDCQVGLCKVCDVIQCARDIEIEPRIQPGIAVDTTKSDLIKIVGNVGILS